MGVLNVTPDSFSDGGLYLTPSEAIRKGREMLDEGADLIDVGGESTRPGAEPVEIEEEIRRVVPVVEALAGRDIKVSVDTMKSQVAATCLAHGATMVNDVSALADPAMAEVCAKSRCEVCLMHMKGEPRTMQNNPHYGDVVAEVYDVLMARAALAEAAGIDQARIWIDPGIGFGKTIRHNLQLLNSVPKFSRSPYRVMIGTSRKSFIGKLLSEDDPSERLEGTLAAQVLAQAFGAQMIRTHDVRASRRAIEITHAILTS